MKKNVSERHWCEIDLDALAHNFDYLRKRAGGARIMAMVKANAYGHGAFAVGRHLARLGCDMLACAQASEVGDLRKAGVHLPVLLLNPALPFEIGQAVRAGVEFCAGSREEILRLARAAGGRKPIRIHVKMDTGMGRLGCPPGETGALCALVRARKGLELAAVMSHFACADSDPGMTRRQWNLFRQYAPPGVPLHISNSAGLLAYPEMSCSLVRPGIALYGYNPVEGQTSSLLRPVLSWHARVLMVKEVAKGATLSYGATFRAPKPMRVATVAAGYADGYSRLHSNRAMVLVNGRRCPVVGRVTMDMILVDVGRAGKVVPGTQVTLIGKQGKQRITAEDLARWSNTICYEVLTGIGVREPRMVA